MQQDPMAGQDNAATESVPHGHPKENDASQAGEREGPVVRFASAEPAGEKSLSITAMTTSKDFLQHTIPLIILFFSLASILVKFIFPDLLKGLDAEGIKWLLSIIVICLFFPLVSKLDLFGVKIELKEQVKELSNIVSAIPDFVLGRYYEEDNDMQAAIGCYQKSIGICREFWPSWFAMGSLYPDYEKYITDAFRCYNEVLKIDGSNEYAKVNLADLYITYGDRYKDLEAALSLIKETLKTRPGMPLAIYYKNEALNKLNRYGEALKYLNSIEGTEEMEEYKHWLLLEKCISRSNMGEKITETDIKMLLKLAKDNNQRQDMIDFLHKDEKVRFKKSDQEIIENYLKTHKLKASKNA